MRWLVLAVCRFTIPRQKDMRISSPLTTALIAASRFSSPLTTALPRFAPLRMCNDGAMRPPPEQLCNLMMQCAVQASLSYHNEFKNEVKARWLQAFLGHEHLEVERVSDHGGGRLLYRGLSDGLRCSWDDYLRTMIKGKTEVYSCRYKVGTADTAGVPSGGDPTGAALSSTGELPAWAAASASRAANPYLKKAAQYREYTETVEPRRVAQALMSICRQLVREWRDDLRYVESEGAYLAQCCGAAGEFEMASGAFTGEREAYDSVPGSLLDELDDRNTTRAALNPTLPLPSPLYASLRAATGGWLQDADEDETPSPFRAENLDLLQRACTREAAVRVLSKLSAASDEPRCAASAHWLRGKLSEWLPRFESPARSQLAGLLLVEILTAAPTPQTLDDGRLGMSDPMMVAEELLLARRSIANEWREELTMVPASLQSLLAEDLEETLTKEHGRGGEGGADGGDPFGSVGGDGAQ